MAEGQTEITLEVSGDALNVRAKPPCCNRSVWIGCIYEVESENPVLQLFRPFGVDGVGRILAALEEWKANDER